MFQHMQRSSALVRNHCARRPRDDSPNPWQFKTMTTAQRLSQWIIPPALLFVALGAYRFAMVRPLPDKITPAKSEPWVIAPRFTEPRIATDEQLVAVLNRVKPPTGKDQMTNNFVHA